MLRLIDDETPAVTKRALRAGSKIIRIALKWIAVASIVTPDMENAWNQLSNLKVQVINMIDSDNDG